MLRAVDSWAAVDTVHLERFAAPSCYLQAQVLTAQSLPHVEVAMSLP